MGNGQMPYEWHWIKKFAQPKILRQSFSPYLIALIRVRQLSVWRHHIGEVQTSHLPAPIRARVRVVLTNQRRALPEPGTGVEPQQRGYHGLGQPRHRGQLQQGRGQHPGEARGDEQRRVQYAHLERGWNVT